MELQITMDQHGRRLMTAEEAAERDALLAEWKAAKAATIDQDLARRKMEGRA